jgi:hypothetical protein
MTIPSIAFGLVCSLFIGALFHVCVDGGPGRLILFEILGMIGFAAGQWVGSEWNLVWFPIGPLNMGLGILGSLLVLGIGYWLSMVRVKGSPPNHKV